MDALFAFLYFACFAAIAGGAFALMRQNLRQTDWRAVPIAPRPHPEAPEPGDSVMYVDLSRERLESLYNQAG